jgi:hypothetical protein
MSAWTDFVSKVYKEGKRKNKEYAFKDALKDASKRKHEMGSSSHSSKSKTSKKGGSGSSGGKRHHNKTRRHRRTRRH